MLDGIVNGAGRMTARLYAGTLLKMEVEWRAPLPAGAKIIAVNHPTTTDPFLLMGVIPEPINILITEMCFQVPGLAQFLRQAGHIPVVDGKGRAAFDEAVKRLKAGRTVGIFPEGALSPLEGGVCPPHSGAARLALTTGAPIIPVGIGLEHERITFREITAGGKTETARWYFHGPYAVTAGEAMHFEGEVEDREHVRAVSQRIMQRISLLARESAQRISALQAADSGTRRAAALARTGY